MARFHTIVSSAAIRRCVRALATLALFAVGADCALVAGIEDIRLVASDAGDDGAGPASDAAGEASVDGSDEAAAEASADAPSDVLVQPEGSVSCACGPTQTCVQGTCYPQVLASGRSNPSSIIIVGSNVVWIDGETPTTTPAVVSCPTTGCAGAPNTIATGLVSPVLRRASPQGKNTLIELDRGAAPVRTITNALTVATLQNDDHVFGAAAASSAVLWGSADKIHYCDQVCGGTAVSVIFAANTTPPTGPAMELFGGRAFWTPPAGGLKSCTPSACDTPKDMLPSMPVIDFEFDAIGGVALTSNQVVSFSSNASPMTSMPLAGGVGLVMDVTNAYVASRGGILAMSRANPAGMQPRWPAADPHGIATDGTFLYWTDGDAVLRAPK